MTLDLAASSAFPPCFEAQTDQPEINASGTASLLPFPVSQPAEEGAWTYATTVLPLANGRRAELLIPVEVRVAHEYVAITEPQTAVHGVGDSVDAAFRDFRQAVFDHIDLLSESSNLSPGLRQQFAYLTYYLSRVNMDQI